MRFVLKPTVRQLALVFPVLLIAMPIVINAADDKPGVVLPPPSLYDTVPAPKASASEVGAPNTPASPAQVQSAPVSAPAATAPSPSVEAKPNAPAQPAAVAPSVNSAMTPGPTRSSKPWYRRLFSWLPSFSARPVPEQQALPETSAAVQPADPGGRGLYAYDGPNRTIRTGMFGDCVKTGSWNPSGASPDCEPTAVARGAADTETTVAQVPRPYAAGSAPAAPERHATPPATGPVEVVPLPPATPTARDELPESPTARAARDEIITALAEARPMPEPDLEKLTLSAGALFPLSSTSIKPLGREKLDDLVARLKDMDYETVRIVGHTDPTGSAAMNDRLSKRRAEAVKSYLASKGIDPKRIQTRAKGGAEPLPKTQDCDALPRMEKIICYAPDRRVEIEVVAGKPRG